MTTEEVGHEEETGFESGKADMANKRKVLAMVCHAVLAVHMEPARTQAEADSMRACWMPA